MHTGPGERARRCVSERTHFKRNCSKRAPRASAARKVRVARSSALLARRSAAAASLGSRPWSRNPAPGSYPARAACPTTRPHADTADFPVQAERSARRGCPRAVHSPTGTASPSSKMTSRAQIVVGRPRPRGARDVDVPVDGRRASPLPSAPARRRRRRRSGQPRAARVGGAASAVLPAKSRRSGGAPRSRGRGLRSAVAPRRSPARCGPARRRGRRAAWPAPRPRRRRSRHRARAGSPSARGAAAPRRRPAGRPLPGTRARTGRRGARGRRRSTAGSRRGGRTKSTRAVLVTHPRAARRRPGAGQGLAGGGAAARGVASIRSGPPPRGTARARGRRRAVRRPWRPGRCGDLAAAGPAAQRRPAMACCRGAHRRGRPAWRGHRRRGGNGDQLYRLEGGGPGPGVAVPGVAERRPRRAQPRRPGRPSAPGRRPRAELRWRPRRRRCLRPGIPRAARPRGGGPRGGPTDARPSPRHPGRRSRAAPRPGPRAVIGPCRAVLATRAAKRRRPPRTQRAPPRSRAAGRAAFASPRVPPVPRTRPAGVAAPRLPCTPDPADDVEPRRRRRWRRRRRRRRDAPRQRVVRGGAFGSFARAGPAPSLLMPGAARRRLRRSAARCAVHRSSAASVGCLYRRGASRRPGASAGPPPRPRRADAARGRPGAF